MHMWVDPARLPLVRRVSLTDRGRPTGAGSAETSSRGSEAPVRRLVEAYVSWALLLGVGVVLLAIETFDTDLKDPAPLTLFVVGTLATLVGSSGLGRTSGHLDARGLIRPLAGPPFRRTFGLYRHLDRLRYEVNQSRQSLARLNVHDQVPLKDADHHLAILAARIEEQYQSANDAAREWAEILPEDVAALQQAQPNGEIDD